MKLTLNTGTLIGSATATAVGGIATFSDWDTGGSYTFSRQEFDLFDVTAAAADKLVFDATQPVDSGSGGGTFPPWT